MVIGTGLTDIPQQAQNQPYQQSPENMLVNTVILYYAPVLIFVGVLSNLLVSIILMCSVLKQFSSSHYICGIVLVNSLYLLVLSLQWLTMLGYNIYNRSVACHVVDMLGNFSSFLSVWLPVAFSVDRYIFICWPPEMPKMCTSMRARIVIICLMIFAITVYLNTSLTVGIVIIHGEHKCKPLPVSYRQMEELQMLDLFINHTLPYLTVILLLVLMSRTVCCQRRGLSIFVTDPSQIWRTTVAYFVVFLITNIPADCLRMFVFFSLHFKVHFDMQSVNVILAWEIITQYLAHTAMALNLLILSLTYPLFRQCGLETLKLRSICCKGYIENGPQCRLLKPKINRNKADTNMIEITESGSKRLKKVKPDAKVYNTSV